MKNARTKITTGYLLITLLFSSTGCILTNKCLENARGYTYQQVPASQIKKGDKVGFDSDGVHTWVIQYPTNKDNSNLKMPEMPKGYYDGFWVCKPKPAYYALVPFTFVVDVVFFPVEIFMVPYWFAQHS